MKEFLFSLLTAVLAAGMIKALGAGTVYDKYLRYVCALLLTLGLLSPLRALMEADLALPEFSFGDKESTLPVPESFLRRFEYETEEAVAALLEAEFSFGKEICGVKAVAEDDGGMPRLILVKVTVRTLKGAAATGKIRKHLETACGCEVQVEEDIG